MITLSIPCHQYRSLPSPSSNSKIGLFYTKAAAVPQDLKDWRDVNPREVSTTSAVYDAIITTLVDYPERFFDRNRGLTLSVKDIDFDEKRKEVTLTLDDKKLHGVLDGGHTLHAILQTQTSPPEAGWPANVFIKAITGIELDEIAEIAGGLNRSQQVDLKSLENLKSHFAELKAVLAHEPYANKIGYVMNEAKPIDVREVLYYLAVMDCDSYDANRHPTALFGRKEGIVRRFADQASGKDKLDSFRVLISKAPEILRLRDEIEKKALSRPNIGQFKAGKKDRIKSPKHRKNDLHFLNEKVDGKIALGWVMPMLGGFRANIDWRNPEGSFSWKVPTSALLESCIDRLVSSILEIHQRENSKPEYVGRSATAWRVCYDAVENAILQHKLKDASAK